MWRKHHGEVLIMKGNSSHTQLFAAALLLLLSSCGSPFGAAQTSRVERRETGLIASCTAAADAETLQKQFGIRYRVLNKKRKLIEFFGVQQNKLQELLPKARFSQNKFYEKLVPQVQSEEEKSQFEIQFIFYCDINNKQKYISMKVNESPW